MGGVVVGDERLKQARMARKKGQRVSCSDPGSCRCSTSNDLRFFFFIFCSIFADHCSLLGRRDVQNYETERDESLSLVCLFRFVGIYLCYVYVNMGKVMLKRSFRNVRL